MRERPRSITVIGWILIVMGGTSLIRTTLNLHNPRTNEVMIRFLMSLPIMYAFSYVGLLISLVCGIGMLKARNWARFLWVVWSVVSLVFACVNFSGSPLPFFKWGTLPGNIMLFLSLAFPLVIAFSLFSPKANEYFTGTEIQGDS